MRIEGQKDVTSVLLDCQEKTFDIPENAKWVHLNADSKGFYCAKYDNDMMAALSAAVKNGDKSLTAIDKVVLIRDTSGLAEAGEDGVTVQLLDIIFACKNETVDAVWDSALEAAGNIAHIIDDNDKIMEDFNTVMRNTLETIWNKLRGIFYFIFLFIFFFLLTHNKTK